MVDDDDDIGKLADVTGSEGEELTAPSRGKKRKKAGDDNDAAETKTTGAKKTAKDAEKKAVSKKGKKAVEKA